MVCRVYQTSKKAFTTYVYEAISYGIRLPDRDLVIKTPGIQVTSDGTSTE